MLYKIIKFFGFKIKECFIIAKETNKICSDLEEWSKNKNIGAAGEVK